MLWAFVLFGLAAGAMLPFQAGINAELAEHLGSPLCPALVSFVVGVLVLVPVLLLFVRGLPSAERAGAAPWWALAWRRSRGVLRRRQHHVCAEARRRPLIAVILAGQALASLVVDHFGMVGFDEHPATLGRVPGPL